MAKYLKRFETMVAEIEKNPILEIVEFKLNSPVSSDELKRVEKKTGTVLDESVKAFYSETNGLYLRWRIDPMLDRKKTELLKKTSSDYTISIAESDSEAFAKINIIRLTDVFEESNQLKSHFLPESHTKEISFNNNKYQTDEFIKMIKPFDLFQLQSNMAFFADPKEKDYKIILLAVDNVSLTNSHVTNFENYLEFLLASRGIAEAREKVFQLSDNQKSSDQLKDPTYWTKFSPLLFT